MNWIRLKPVCVTCANERAARVFARPGIVLEQHVSVGEQAEQDELERVALADDGALDLVEDAPCVLLDLGELHQSASSEATTFRREARLDPAAEALERLLAVGAHELPGLVAERAPRGLGARVEVDPAAGAEQLGGDPAQRRAQPEMEVERSRLAERDLALDLLELGDPLRLARTAVECGVDRRHALLGQRAAQARQQLAEDERGDQEHVHPDR